jgi:hypothetical protein
MRLWKQAISVGWLTAISAGLRIAHHDRGAGVKIRVKQASSEVLAGASSY